MPQAKPVPAGFVPDGFEPDAPVASSAAQPSAKPDPFAAARSFAGGAPAGELWQNVKDHPVQAAIDVGSAALAEGIPTALKAIPSAARAAGKFQEVMGAARQVPIDITGPGNVALRIQELADRGGSMPMAVRKFLLRVTDPAKPAMAYEEARDFASNNSRLSADEFQRLTPVVAREVSEMRVALNKAVADAAGKAGKGREYASAMTEYAKAMRLQNAINEVVTGAKRGLPYVLGGAGAAGAGYWLTNKITSLLGGD